MCVATYRRPDLLEALLASLAVQRLPAGCGLEVVLVDNDAAGSAGAVAERWRDRLDLRYAVEPERNISLARNRTVALARGDVLAFIDDDETAGPDWLATALEALDRYEADVVFGPVLCDFAHAPPRWMAENPYFNLGRWPSGSEVHTGGTGNCVLGRSVLALAEDGGAPFDPRLGRTGGEDAFLFDLFRRRGARLVFVQEAWVREHVPAERLRLGWLIRRAYRTGNMYAKRQVELAAWPRRAALTLAVRASAVLLLSAARTILSLHSSPRAAWGLRAVSAFGQLSGLAGTPIQGY